MKERIFYVSPLGDDRGRGTQSAPFATLERASESVRKARQKNPEKGCRVILAGGLYQRHDTWILTEADCGSQGAPVIWCAQEGETPVITGAVTLYAADFERADDAFVAELREKPLRPVYRIDLNRAGVEGWKEMTYTDGARYAELYVGEERFFLPNYPKGDFMKLENQKSDTSFTEKHRVPASWKSFEGIRAFGYMEADYFSVDTAPTRDGDLVEMHHRFEGGRSYRYYNVPYELSDEKEYYIDRKNGYLYVCPGEDFAGSRIVISQLAKPLLQGEGLHDLTFAGITFEGCRQDGLLLRGDRITFDGCTLCKMGKDGLHLEGMQNRIVFCHAYAIGDSPIRIGGGDCTAMRDAGTLVDSNHIHHFALNGGTYCAGISVTGGIGHKISHNHIHHTIHNAINGYCPDLLVEYNLIHDVCQEAHDAGAIYTGRWHSRNTVYRYNLIYDNVNINGLGVPFGIYNDDSGSGKKIYGNILWNVAGYGVKQGCGNNNEIYNNIFIDTLVSVDDDDRSMYGRFQEKECRFDGFFFREQVNFPAGGTRSWIARNASATLIKYTTVHTEGDRWISNATGLTAVKNNLSIHASEVQIGEGHRNQSVSRDNVRYETPADAGVVLDTEHHTFRILPDSPVWRDLPYWQDIPREEIGPRTRV